MEDLEFLENPVIKKSEEIKELETNSEGVVEENEGNINNVKLKHFFIANAFYFLPQLFYAFYVLFLEFKVDPNHFTRVVSLSILGSICFISIIRFNGFTIYV